jgi:hypothetical protein
MSERNRLAWIVGLGTLVICVGLVLSVGITNYVGSPRSKTLAIVNNLRQLDGAMQQWASDHRQAGTVVVTKEQLAPYLSPIGGWVKPVAGERYILKTVSESPEARLTGQLEGRPKGTVLLLDTNGGFRAILPNQED